MFSRRHWLTTTFFASTGTLWRSVRAGEDDFSHACLLSDVMLGFVHSQRSPDILIDPTFSTLDRFVIQPVDLAFDPSGCPEFSFSLTERHIQFHAAFAPPAIKPRILTLANWTWIGGLERSFQTPVLPTLSATMDFCADLLGILRQHVGSGSAWRLPAEVDPDVMRVATRCARLSVLDRTTSPFYHASFHFQNWHGDWTATEDLLLDGPSEILTRIGAVLKNAGAHQHSSQAYSGVCCDAILAALNEMKSVN